MSERKVKERHGQVRRQPWRLWAFAVIVVAVLSAVWLFLKPTPRPTAPAATEANAGGSRVISIEADMAGFSTKVIRAKVGEPLTVQLTSLDNRFHTDGGGRHQFAIDELNVNIIAPPEGTATATFTPTKPGVYEFYCDICWAVGPTRPCKASLSSKGRCSWRYKPVHRCERGTFFYSRLPSW